MNERVARVCEFPANSFMDFIDWLLTFVHESVVATGSLGFKGHVISPEQKVQCDFKIAEQLVFN